MRITRLIYAFMGISLCMMLQTSCTGKTTTEETTPEKANTLASATEIINSRCPEMVDVESRLDSVLFSDEGHLAYYYTLLERDKININPAAFNAYLLPGIIDNIRTNPDLRMHRDSSVTMVFNYRDRQGEFITEFLVGPGRYR
jgi:hypothetical protein